MLRISAREGYVRRFTDTFQVIVLRHHWYEPRVRWKLLLLDDPRREAAPVPFEYPKRGRRRKRA